MEELHSTEPRAAAKVMEGRSLPNRRMTESPRGGGKRRGSTMEEGGAKAGDRQSLPTCIYIKKIYIYIYTRAR